METTRDHEVAAELLGVYAVDGLSPPEREFLEFHLVTCVTCQEELDGHRDTLMTALATDAEPAAWVWEYIRERAGAGVRVTHKTLRLAYYDALADTSARVARLPVSMGGNVTVVLLPGGNGFLASANVPDAPRGSTYQLWATPASSNLNRNTISLGVFGLHLDLAGFTYSGAADTFALTVETDGGATLPSRSSVAAGRLAT